MRRTVDGKSASVAEFRPKSGGCQYAFALAFPVRLAGRFATTVRIKKNGRRILRDQNHGTPNTTLLVSTPLELLTVTTPVVAPDGTVALISEPETSLNTAVVPLKLT